MAFNDVDFCLKVRKKGWLVVYNPQVEMYHFESKTRGYEDTEEKRQRFELEKCRLRKRWKQIFEQGDPCYNPNLSLKTCDYSMDSQPYKKNEENDMRELSVVIPNWNGMAYLKACLDSLENQSFQNFEILMVDNGSKDGGTAFVRKHYPQVRILELDQNYGFCRAVNLGIRSARAPISCC